MASTICLAAAPSSSLLQNDRIRGVVASTKSFSLFSSARFLCRSQSCLTLSQSSGKFTSLLVCPFLKRKRIGNFAVLAVVDEEDMTEEDIEYEEYVKEINGNVYSKKELAPCELYVCNLPRSCDIAELLKMFQPFGTVVSLQVSRNPETGISRGCGSVTMSSISSARNAISALDGSDVGGREMRVRFSVDMNTRGRDPQFLNSAPKKNLIYESPHKLYVGNLGWYIKPEDLKDHFSQFGTVVSVKVLHDNKEAKRRAYGFLSFSSASERDAAMELDGTEFRSRTLLVREIIEKQGTLT
ncbi:putative ribonucleoprotein chloroplast [Tripterygium wilfordii]|uniref:Putative ribonucleoprotein chloroplast n=1 Tax=Tripterygium wilfordii TaxID=458696 RepID=A0A7J7CH69_TRIWF|nr:RNA-binding protein CP33, chloroplastic [Tripterygium wilfordii]XP_038682195.1 RNA-binding protein CP33, chloroplastic [Tripterygium wilfordii]XP_038682196.1 RNA-binding protein CP33, chloroplastic [Tripterygium wilfordii]KAF5733386.1 putative ribonucleoprotein chloroplast [Tripterygium wilfordii]